MVLVNVNPYSPAQDNVSIESLRYDLICNLAYSLIAGQGSHCSLDNPHFALGVDRVGIYINYSIIVEFNRKHFLSLLF